MCRLRENAAELSGSEPSTASYRRYPASHVARRVQDLFDSNRDHDDRVHSAVNQAIHGWHCCSVLHQLVIAVLRVISQSWD